MTLRSRPAGTRHRTLDDRDRRNMYLNIGFGLVVLLALALLALTFGISWYNDHLAQAASVNGQVISRDEFRTRLAIDTFRYDYLERRVRTMLNAGYLPSTDAQSRLALIDQRKQQAAAIALERLIDQRIMEELAPGEGVAMTDADVDAKLLEEATTPEVRHAWFIEVAPVLGEGETEPTAAATAEANRKAGAALAELRAGKSWDEVAKSLSADGATDAVGDVGFIDDEVSLDEGAVKAVFAVAVNTPTEVVEGEDGTFRIGRWTEKVDASVDPTLEQQVRDEGLSIGDFREALRADGLREKLNDTLIARYTAPGPQRRVAEIFMQASDSETSEGAVRVRHILYSPNDDPAGAAAVAETDPAWAAAEAEARATWSTLEADISQFDAIARKDSDEGLATTSGGKLPYFSPLDAIDPAFAAAIFTPGLEPGQLLEPVRSSFGWHVIQIMHFPTDMAWAAKLKAEIEGGADFATLARDNSDLAEAATGGEIGWVTKGQLGPEVEGAIFATPVGGLSVPLNVEADGVHLFKVFEEQTRELDPDQRRTIERTVFTTWYSAKKAGYLVERDASLTGLTG